MTDTKLSEALNWYAEMAMAARRATMDVDNQLALHVLKEMALDGGKRARDAQETSPVNSI